MPPKRCPECGRFLSNQLVASLASGPQPCPRCESPLAADTIVGGSGAVSVGAASGGTSSGGAASGGPERASGSAAPARAADAAPIDSVRPPDLDPVDVRAPDGDVLAGWDVGATREEIEGWQHDQRPFPTDTVVVASGAILGGVAGALLSPRHRAWSSVAGVIAGAVTAAASVRIWELRG